MQIHIHFFINLKHTDNLRNRDGIKRHDIILQDVEKSVNFDNFLNENDSICMHQLGFEKNFRIHLESSKSVFFFFCLPLLNHLVLFNPVEQTLPVLQSTSRTF